METVNNQDVLIRLLKDGHISKNEFKSLCESEVSKPKIRCYKDCGNTYPSGGLDNICLNCGSSIFRDTNTYLENRDKKPILKPLSEYNQSNGPEH